MKKINFNITKDMSVAVAHQLLGFRLRHLLSKKQTLQCLKIVYGGKRG